MPEVEEWHWYVGWEPGECRSYLWTGVRIRDDLVLVWSSQYKEFDTINPTERAGAAHRPEECTK